MKDLLTNHPSMCFQVFKYSFLFLIIEIKLSDCNSINEKKKFSLERGFRKELK